MRLIRMPVLVVVGIALAASAALTVKHVQAEQYLSERSVHEVVEQLARSLEQGFLDPAVGRRYSQALREGLDDGRYRGLTPAALARRVTGDLQKVHPDGHLRLTPPSDQPLLGAPSAAAAEQESAHTGIQKSGWMSDGVAYIGFELFPASKASLSALREFLEKHGSARALLIDLRTHGGGYSDEIDVLASYLYDRPVQLIAEDTRGAAYRPKPDTATLKRTEGPAGFVRELHLAAPNSRPTNLRQAKILVLTSGYTGSAAEHLALALKRTGRATLIGETTAGMGHFTRIFELPHGFSAVVPIGRPFDPDTGIGWEGIGVEPHVEVPAKKALEVALRQLGLPQQQARTLGFKWMPAGDMDRVIPLRKVGAGRVTGAAAIRESSAAKAADDHR